MCSGNEQRLLGQDTTNKQTLLHPTVQPNLLRLELGPKRRLIPFTSALRTIEINVTRALRSALTRATPRRLGRDAMRWSMRWR